MKFLTGLFFTTIVSICFLLFIINTNYAKPIDIEELDKQLSFVDFTDSRHILPVTGSCVSFSMLGVDRAKFSAYIVSSRVLEYFEQYGDNQILLKGDMLGGNCIYRNECNEHVYLSDYWDYKVMVVENYSGGSYLYNLQKCEYVSTYVMPAFFLLIEVGMFGLFLGLICHCI